MRSFAVLLLAFTALTVTAFSQAALRPGDSFEMQLNGPPVEYTADFRGVYTVADNGTVSVPLVGPMRAQGMTPSQFAQSVERKLVDERLFTKPTILINLAERTRFVTVGGAVRAPQAVPWSPDLSLSSAIMRAGGATEFGNMKKIRVTRDGEARLFNLRIADKDPTQNVKLLPGDEVQVFE
jgi:protein involved in polysaccharide export with SLBB domain